MIKKIALIGNPNVGKSTIFNTLTKNKVHTGNWPGKTVGNNIGKYNYKGNEYIIQIINIVKKNKKLLKKHYQ